MEEKKHEEYPWVEGYVNVRTWEVIEPVLIKRIGRDRRQTTEDRGQKTDEG